MYFKKITVLLFSMCIIIIFIKTTASANEAVIDTNNLNVRSGPGTNFDKIEQVHSEEIYPILQKQNEWVEIQLADRSGWITTAYITIKEESSEPSKFQSLNTDEIVTIPYDNTQIREGPSTNDTIISFAKKDDTFELISENDNWYEVSDNQVTGYIYKGLIEKDEQTPVNNLKNKTILIDAGHGGDDVGAIGASGTFEKNIALRTTKELEQKLSILGAKVILTRSDDTYIGLASRTSLANILDIDAFISIHYNSFPESPDITGIGTYYYYEQNKPLANAIQNELIKETGAVDRNVAYENFQVLRQTFKPAVLVELGFISNSNNEQLFLTNAYQEKLVKGIIIGLTRQFTNS